MSFQNDFAEFVSVLTLELCDIMRPHQVAELACEVVRLATIRQRYAIALCNRETTPAEDKRKASASFKLSALLAPYFIQCIGGDPRGYTTKLILPKTKVHNTGGGVDEGYGIPTRD